VGDHGRITHGGAVFEVTDTQYVGEAIAHHGRLTNGALAAGDAVSIREGAFSGYAGIVLEERGSHRLIVSVSILKKSVSVEFPRELLAQVKATGTGRDRRRV